MKEIKLYHDDSVENGLYQIKDNSIDAIITDPPYMYIKGSDFDTYFDEDKFFEHSKRLLKDDGIIVLFGRGESFYRWNYKLSLLGFVFIEEIIWDKTQVSNPMNAIHRVHETISIFGKTNKAKIIKVKIPYIEKKQDDISSIIQDIKRISSALNSSEFDELKKFLETKQLDFNKEHTTKHKITVAHPEQASRSSWTAKMIIDGGNETSIIKINREHYKAQHPSQKPVDLMERLINITCKKDSIVLDPFMGSGSTGVACVKTNMNFIGFEKNEKYYKVAKKRIYEEQPVLELE